MGEFSKKIGDQGEKVVSEFLKMIGWTDLIENVEITSINPEKHKKKTNGIDRLFQYPSPMITNTIESIVISSKYSTQPYPSVASAKTTFKNHFTDLAQTIESFKASPLKNDILDTYDHFDDSFDRGVLFWLNNSGDADIDLLQKVSNSEINSESIHDGIYLMDNKRVEFIYDSLKYPKIKFDRSIDIDFIYYLTGLNSNTSTVRNGKVLPVQLINSSILPVRIFDIDRNETTIYLSCIDSFSKEHLQMVMGLIKNISGNLHVNAIICYPDYSPFQHEQTVNILKQSLKDPSFTTRLTIDNYNSPIIN